MKQTFAATLTFIMISLAGAMVRASTLDPWAVTSIREAGRVAEAARSAIDQSRDCNGLGEARGMVAQLDLYVASPRFAFVALAQGDKARQDAEELLDRKAELTRALMEATQRFCGNGVEK